MMISIYLLGACISGLAWVFLTRARLKGYSLRFAGENEGVLLHPLDPGTVNYPGLMAGSVLMALFWPVGWGVILFFYVGMALTVFLCFLWSVTLGNGKLARKVFGADKREKD